MVTRVNVTVLATDQNGGAVANARVTAKLTVAEVDPAYGYILPETVTAMTDDAGSCVLALWPNQLGSTQSQYEFKILNPDTAKTLTVNATIPNNDCYLHEVAELPPYEGKTEGQIALDAAQAAMASAQQSAQDADGSATTAAGSAVSASDAEEAAALSAAAAAQSADVASASAVAASDSATAAGGQAAAAAAAKTAAETAAAAANAVATNVSVVRHSLRPSLLLAFGALKQLDPRITFTRASKAGRWNAKCQWEVVDANKPRFDHDPATGECKGLLIEEARTNLLTYSAQLVNSAWSKTRCSVIPNAGIAPDGLFAASKHVEDASATNTHFVQQPTFSYTAGQAYTASVFAKAGERSMIELWFPGIFPTIRSARFDLVAGTAVHTGTGLAKIEPVGNGWYRCIFTLTCETTGSGYGCSVNLHNGSSITYTGDGVSGAYLWGAQLEVGAFATSYIPSATAFTSRASNKWEFNSAGVLTQYANDVAVTAYDPVTLVSKGLSLEAAATNVIRNCTMQGAVAGTPGTLPTNWSVAASPDGLTQTVVGVGVENGIEYIDVRYAGTLLAGNTTFAISMEGGTTVACASGQTWTHSQYLKLVAGSLNNITSITVNLLTYSSDGTTSLENLNSASLAGTLNGTLTRNAVTRTLGNASDAFITPRLRIVTGASGSNVDFTIRIGLPNLVQDTGVTSPIKTSGTAVTRAADVSSSPQVTRAADAASMPVSSQWYNSTEGTLYLEFDTPVPMSRSDSAVIAGFDDGTANNRFAPFYTSNTKAISANLVSGGAQQYQVTAASVADLATGHKVALAYKSGDNALAADGGAPNTSANSSAIPAVNTLRFGIRPGGTQANLHIKRLAYYPKRLSNAEVQAITA